MQQITTEFNQLLFTGFNQFRANIPPIYINALQYPVTTSVPPEIIRKPLVF